MSLAEEARNVQVLFRKKRSRLKYPYLLILLIDLHFKSINTLSKP
jgi:hypothetical protein